MNRVDVAVYVISIAIMLVSIYVLFYVAPSVNNAFETVIITWLCIFLIGLILHFLAEYITS